MSEDQELDSAFIWRDGVLVSRSARGAKVTSIGLGCSCRPAEGVQCQFHARQPRPCPSCAENGRTGVLQRYSGKEGFRMVSFVLTDEQGYARRGEARVRRQPSHKPFWACNVCEHCE